MRATLLRAFLRGVLAIPAAITRLRVGDPPRNDRGTMLDRETHLLVWLENHAPARLGGGGITRGTPAEARAAMRRSVSIVASQPSARLEVHDDRVPGGPAVRVYRPEGDPRPVLVYLHGGGWVQGDLDTHDALCRRLAAEGNRAVVSVDYRLAPEHPFPAGLEDVLQTLRWIPTADLGGPTLAAEGRVSVGGDSAGGNLAAAACIALRDGGEALPELQVLVYPGLDQTRALASHQSFARGFLLTAADIDWFQRHYAVTDLRDPLASPLLAPDLRGLPPAIVTTAGFDPLRDEGEAYVARLREAGVPVVHLDESSLVHGYACMDGVVAEADAAVSRLAAVIRAG
ncbi:MAG: alpha/beta hydrolase [Pseudomonadota bacterium]|nr:alpha/beta hydrolase [Pseudomonadota bacterium]